MKYLAIINKLNKREKSLFFGVAALILAWLIFSIAIEPFCKRWASLNKNIEISKLDLQKKAKMLKQREYVLKEYTRYLPNFITKGSDEEEMALMLNEIELQARKALVRIVNMKPRRAIKNDFYRIYYVDLDTEATMQSILTFIKGLKDSKLSLSVDQLTLNSRTSDPSILVGKMAVSRLGLEIGTDN